MLAAAIKDIERLTDSTERGRAAHDAVTTVQDGLTQLSNIRRDALAALLEQGLTKVEIARALDVSPQRVGQLMSSSNRAARAVLGTAAITFAIGGKYEAEKKAPVLSTQAFAAYERLATLARTLGLESSYEVIPPPGMVDLNRPDLIVIGSPRILPFLTQVLPADPAYGWKQGKTGWFIVDKTNGKEYHSDLGENARTDYAYVGRLPRPDAAGTFLYLAGIHAPGTAGAAAWLAENIGLVHREAKTKRWSAVIEVTHDVNQVITDTRTIAPISRHEAGNR